MSEPDEFRKAKDASFREGHDSPLSHDQRHGFDGLAYFEASPSLRFALEPELLPGHEDVEIEMSTGDASVYQHWAKVRFEVEGQPAELTVFRDADGRDLFLPFKDATAASGETYGAGRYLDIDQRPDGWLLLDFNYAYNSYCAYNDQWSCPLTPPENVLHVPIRAGGEDVSFRRLNSKGDGGFFIT